MEHSTKRSPNTPWLEFIVAPLSLANRGRTVASRYRRVRYSAAPDEPGKELGSLTCFGPFPKESSNFPVSNGGVVSYSGRTWCGPPQEPRNVAFRLDSCDVRRGKETQPATSASELLKSMERTRYICPISIERDEFAELTWRTHIADSATQISSSIQSCISSRIQSRNLTNIQKYKVLSHFHNHSVSTKSWDSSAAQAAIAESARAWTRVSCLCILRFSSVRPRNLVEPKNESYIFWKANMEKTLGWFLLLLVHVI